MRTDAQRLLDRMSGDESIRGAYAVLAVATADEAERFVLSLPALGRGAIVDAAWSGASWFRWVGVGPLDALHRRELFDRWITLRLRRLYGGVLPDDVPAAAFAALYGSSPDTATTDVLVQRRADGPGVWLRAAGAATANLATCARGRWEVQRDLPPPRALRRHRSPGTWILLAPLLPLVMLSWLVARTLRPLERLDQRRRRGRVERARSAAGVTSSPDGDRATDASRSVDASGYHAES